MAGAAIPAGGTAFAQSPPDDAQIAAAAQETAQGVQVYVPLDFAAFAPRTALDMVQQIPGFSIDMGRGGQTRGLGQASGNVLLNGERLSSKSGSITDELARIPADNVLRIELVEGATLSIPGLQGRVANIIAISSDGLQGQFEWRPQMATDFADPRWLDGIVSLSGTTGRLGFTLAIEGRPFRNGSGGTNTISYGDGRVDDLTSITRSRGDDTRYSTSMRYETAGGMIANFNGSYLLRRFRSSEDETLLGLPASIEMVRSSNRGHDLELSGDVDFALGPGRLKLIALNSFARLETGSQSVIDPGTGAAFTGSRFEQVSERGERIGRGEYSWNMLGAEWQLSVEAAFNRLDQVGSLFRLASDGSFTPIPFPSGSGGVTEDRYEALLSFGRPLADGLTMQLIVGGERSTITQTGNDALSRTFLRPKGSFSLAWAVEEGLDISMRIEQRVGQLNFGDFLAAVNLADNNENGSNNQLRPDQSLGGELEIDRSFGAWGNLNARVFIRSFTDFVTIVPTASGGEARGNIANARVMGGEIGGTLLMDPLGIPGARLDLSLDLRDSRFADPVGPGNIPVQFAQPFGFEADFRHDVAGTDIAWGTTFRTNRNNPYYRVAEFGYDYNLAESLMVFVEHKDVFGLTVQARVNNLLEDETVLDRQVFTGPRDVSPLRFAEYRVREIGMVFNFVVKGSF